MTKPLSEIVSDGTLVDNTVHQSEDGFFCVGSRGDQIQLDVRKGWRLNPDYVWPAIQAAAALNPDDGNLVFRVSDDDYEHNTTDAFLRVEGAAPTQCKLITGNLIGSMKDKGFQVLVSSRFGDEFLKYIVADADGFIELPDRGGTDRGSYEWLLVYIWLVKLKKAFRLGLPKAYETHVDTLTRVRGRLDPVDFLQNQERARYLCTYREHSYDNPVARLIARTLRHLDSHSFLRAAHTLNQTFQIATQGRRLEIRELLATRSVRNPYYADYNPVIMLSKKILRNELLNAGDQSQTSAFFFDVAMLFEYFVRKLLNRAGVRLHDKTKRDWEIASGLSNGYSRRRLIPDLVFDIGGRTYVFDVKYKSFDFCHGVNREDLFQLHTYVGQVSNRYPVVGCGFIYPIRESRWRECDLDAVGGIISDTIKQGGRSIAFHVVFLKVPDQSNDQGDQWPNEFWKSFRHSTNAFTRALIGRICGEQRIQEGSPA